MIRLVEINNLARIFKVPAETIEKDYMISWVLFCLSKSDIKDDFVFYGGTAIKRMYFEDHRFSEDIDFLSEKKFNLDKILNTLKILDLAKQIANINLEVNQNNIINKDSRIQLYIDYQGYEEIIGAPKEIRLDFAMDMEEFGQNEEKKMIESYSDLKNVHARLKVFSLNTILANKFGLLFDISRNEPRDVFDIWFLLNKKNEFDFNFERIQLFFKNKYGYKLHLSNVISILKNNQNLRRLWIDRLNKQIPQLPSVDKVINEIIANLVLIQSEGGASPA